MHEQGSECCSYRQHPPFSMPCILCFFAAVQIAGLRSNLWPGAACACQSLPEGKIKFANIYVGWGVKNAPFVPLPPPPVSKEYDAALVESSELPLPPKDGEGEEGQEE